jgi:catechol 2,3-dioxygenase-like lactoylglutathione lyase family enzyme
MKAAALQVSSSAFAVFGRMVEPAQAVAAAESRNVGKTAGEQADHDGNDYATGAAVKSWLEGTPLAFEDQREEVASWQARAHRTRHGEARRIAAMLAIKGIDHVVLRVRDLEAMRRFNCDVLGAVHVAYRPEFAMSHLRVGAAMIDLVAVDGPLGKRSGAAAGIEGRNMDHLCLKVEPFDQDAIVARLKAHGVEVGEVRRRFGAEGNGVSIYLGDPEGNTVELKGPGDGSERPVADA